MNGLETMYNVYNNIFTTAVNSIKSKIETK